MLDRLAKLAPCQRPFALGRRRRQEEILALEGICDLELVIQRDHRNAHAFRGGAGVPPAMERVEGANLGDRGARAEGESGQGEDTQ
jgi:hypothetical protein